MEKVKAEILHSQVEHGDTTVEPTKGKKLVRTVSKKGAVVQIEKGEFEGLEKLKAVRKAKGELKEAPVAASENEAPIGATSAPIAERVEADAPKKGR